MRKTKRATHLHTFNTEIYRSTIYLVIADNMETALRRLPEDFEAAIDKVGDKVEDAAGLFLSDGTGGFALCFTYDNFDLDTMAHEISHLSNEILERNSVRYDVTNDEPGALLIGWITGKVTKRLRAWGIAFDV